MGKTSKTNQSMKFLWNVDQYVSFKKNPDELEQYFCLNKHTKNIMVFFFFEDFRWTFWCQKTAVAISNIAHPKLHKSALSGWQFPEVQLKLFFFFGVKFHPRQTHSCSAVYRAFAPIDFRPLIVSARMMLFFTPVLEGSTFWGASISACSGFTF